jgi:hypothetical protein
MRRDVHHAVTIAYTEEEPISKKVLRALLGNRALGIEFSATYRFMIGMVLP